MLDTLPTMSEAKRGRPKGEVVRRQITTRIEDALLTAFEDIADGEPINTFLEEAMREWLERRDAPPPAAQPKKKRKP